MQFSKYQEMNKNNLLYLSVFQKCLLNCDNMLKMIYID